MSDFFPEEPDETMRPLHQRRHCDDMVAAYRDLLGDGPEARAAGRIYSAALQDIERLRAQGPHSIATIAIVGHVGAGKTWLARCFFVTPERHPQALAELQSGPHEDTQHVIWIGPERPPCATALFFQCPADSLLDLGRPYSFCDTPGLTHERADCRTQASGALIDSQVKLLVSSLTSLRDGATEAFLQSCDGAIIVPVIRLPTAPVDAREPSTDARSTVDRALSAWMEIAPRSRFTEPLFMPNADIVGHDAARSAVQERLRVALARLVQDTRRITTSLAAQAEQRIAQADAEALTHVRGILEKALPSLHRLDAATRRLSDESLRELVGDPASLRAVVRQQLRKEWIERTPDWCFPYKPFLRKFALTAGAWDKLVFVTTGSLPSLAMTLLQAGRNVRDGWKFAQRFNVKLSKRMEAALSDRLQPDLRLLSIATAGSGGAPDVRQPDIRVFGVEELQDWSRGIFMKIVQRHSAGVRTIGMVGRLALASFLLFIAAPAASVFWAYIRSCWDAATQGLTSLSYALPTLSMMLGVATISSAPSVIIAWISMIAACSKGRVNPATIEAQNEHAREISQRLTDHRLRFEVTDPRITSLRRLMAVQQDVQSVNSIA
jgi:hypothetical protein